MDRKQLECMAVSEVVVELLNGSRLVMPEGVAIIFIHWLKCLTANGFSDVTITSKKQKHEIVMQLGAGSVIQTKVPFHQAEDIRKRLAS
ncbi:hypothetical protein D0962_02320 [Leptolyngbyaceae cyanobacterium CCMR0082]|uniref:Uncharacterized protein n=2 Tax=Adonisia turfae TaxID=2950184 RepID=A0A6M0S066_9CYAN|nr:hypothetical protein [Adonisia turfae]MDV3352247.1 hypothetical protein [Leptothoe sp. LEGE 181152]NEZ59478.1 hypothetical protein [Adonisia turfae CCMR0081]NEZ61620.1 hypothetical protein [Adonisia turfae CCMR0082]